MSRVAYEAMKLASFLHKGQQRKYTGLPYLTHLAEVAGIVSTVAGYSEVSADEMIATAWLHDSMEDQGIKPGELRASLGARVDLGVAALSDLEDGTRAERLAASCARLAAAPGWVQTIKCADIISNCSSIRQLDWKFAQTYLPERRRVLDVLTKAHPGLRHQAGDLLR